MRLPKEAAFSAIPPPDHWRSCTSSDLGSWDHHNTQSPNSLSFHLDNSQVKMFSRVSKKNLISTRPVSLINKIKPIFSFFIVYMERRPEKIKTYPHHYLYHQSNWSPTEWNSLRLPSHCCIYRSTIRLALCMTRDDYKNWNIRLWTEKNYHFSIPTPSFLLLFPSKKLFGWQNSHKIFIGWKMMQHLLLLDSPLAPSPQ